MYNPSPTAIAKMDQMYPPTAADSKVTTRTDGKQMIGANSPEATNMREKTSANNQFAATMDRLTKPAQPTQTVQQNTPMMGVQLNPYGDVPDVGDFAGTSFGSDFGYLLDLNKRRKKQGILNVFDASQMA